MGKDLIVQENQIDFKAKAVEWLRSMGTNLPPDKTAQFLELCQAFKLNPFKREIYAVGYGGKFSIITGYEVYLKRAERTHKLDGWQCITNNDGTKAKITIWRKDWQHPFEHEVFMNEVRQNSPIWTKMPIFMMKKVCIEQGMRLCFPDELGGMPYAEEEVSYDTVIASEERNVTPEITDVEPNSGEAILNTEPSQGVIESELVDDRQKLQTMVDKYKKQLDVQNQSGNPYYMACEVIAGGNNTEITKMLARITKYLSSKGLQVA